MRRLIYILTIILLIVSCEDIYQPNIDSANNLLVVEAILISNRPDNSIHLYHTRGFNDADYSYPPVSGANVYLKDDLGNDISCQEGAQGVYNVNQMLHPERLYTLNIELDGDVYVSEMQTVPDVPTLDTIYGAYDYTVKIDGTANSSDNVEKDYGIQLYTDIKYRNNTNHYRFYGRKVLQYIDTYDTVEITLPVTLPIYIWRSIYPSGTFNIAGPPEYSTSKDISKHPLEFYPQNYNKYFADTLSFAGWIYIIDQYGLNEDTYNYYKKMNQQLDAEGKIFDPVYIQLEGNITCKSNPDKKVLGNFEISSYAESRCFLIYNRIKEDFQIKRIPYFYYIPSSGYIKNNMPDFWESIYRSYPHE